MSVDNSGQNRGFPGILGNLTMSASTASLPGSGAYQGFGTPATPATPLRDNGGRPAKWVKVLDQTRCIGCHACTTACKSENQVPVGVSRTYVKSVDVGYFPQVRRAFQVTRCNQCENPPCVTACPTSAMHQRLDGIVDFDKSICIGCKACMAACPYDAIFINPEDHSAEKCNFCAQRLDIGLEPACVVVCPVEAILVGDMNDANSKVAKIINRQPVSVRRPEKETHPKMFYKGAHQATLDPLAATAPGGDTYSFAQKPQGSHIVNAGHPVAGHHNSSAQAVIAYEVGHSSPWDWRVSLYTWTKGISAGAYLVPLALVLFGFMKWTNPLFSIVSPLLALIFLGITGILLIADLKHPSRFYMIFTRPQWKSWLVRGGFIIGVYGAIMTLQLIAGILKIPAMEKILAFPGVPLAVMTEIYTAYLFAQAKARDLWQNPLLPPHLFAQAIFLGAAAFSLIDYNPAAQMALLWIVAVAGIVHLLFVLGESSITHPTAHAHLANYQMTRGKFKSFFWAGIVLVLISIFSPVLGIFGPILWLIGLLAHEHAYVQAAQSVPLA